MSCGDCGGADTTCADCADKHIAALEAKLAEVTAERDAAHGSALMNAVQAALAIGGLEETLRGNRAEVARLRAAIEPTASNIYEYAAVEEAAFISDEACGRDGVAAILAAIRARAGEVSAPGSSLRERVEAACKELDRHADGWRGLRNQGNEYEVAVAEGIDKAAVVVRAALGEP